MSTIVAQICIRRDTAANFTSANPTLALGEIAYETDTRNIKVGTGSTAWTALPYINPFRGNAAAPTSNTVLGSGAGAGLTGVSSSNTVLGSGAGAVLTGDNNTFVGHSAGGAVASGTRNVAVGRLALQNGTGTWNTIVGELAAAAAGGWNSVTAIGNAAARFNTVSDITAVGANALDANTTGTNNTAVGRDALGACTTGTNATAVGLGALASATGANWTTALGSHALSAYTSGNANTALGESAFRELTGGDHNLAVGESAGRFAGAGSTPATSLNESIFVGRLSRANTATDSNTIVIGHNVVGNGSNTTTIGNSSTTATHLNGPSTFSVGANGQATQLGQSTTLLSGLTGATVTATNLIPANCILLGVTARVTTAVTGATTFDIGDGTTANRFGDDIAIALGTTANNCIAPALITAATNVVLTANGSNFTGGAVRLTAHFMALVAPTS